MQLQPRPELLEIWRATSRTAYDGTRWQWAPAGRSNSISDAEQLLCLLSPATEVPVLRLDSPDATADDVVGALAGLGDSVAVPRLLIRVLSAYMTKYADPVDGTPIFAGDSYFGPAAGSAELNEEQRRADVVDSFAISVTLTVAVIGFIRVFRSQLTRETLRNEADRLEQLASRRLSAAMVGLLRSFAVNVFTEESEFGQDTTQRENQAMTTSVRL